MIYFNLQFFAVQPQQVEKNAKKKNRIRDLPILQRVPITYKMQCQSSLKQVRVQTGF